MKNINLLCVGLGLCAVVSTSIPALAGNHARGEWHITTSMQMPGMPVAIPGGSFNQCMNRDGIPHQESPDQKCRKLSRKISGNTVTWHMTCTGPEGDVDMQGTSTYNGNSMHGSMTMTTADGSMTIQMQGQKVGPCR